MKLSKNIFSKKTTEFLKNQKVKVLDWLGMSPDLNAIDHLNVLKRKVEKRRPPIKTELKDGILLE